jgi:arginyl-tRNA synthetase
MVELPEGKMKSREGTVVDADDLIDEMIITAREKSQELGKLEKYSNEEKENIYKTIALGALKYFILKVDPKKGMMFNPKESIDFNGNTGPFIQYTYARVQSILRKAEENKIDLTNFNEIEINTKEKDLIKSIHEFSNIINTAASTYSPAIIANYVYELSKDFNQFYHDFPILKAENKNEIIFRINLSKMIGLTIKNGMKLLGIGVPERM